LSNRIYFLVDPLTIPLFFHIAFQPKEKHDPTFIEAASKRLKDKLTWVNDQLGSREYIVGSTFTVADIALGYVLNICDKIDMLADFKALKDYVGRLSSREAFKRAYGPEEAKDIVSLKHQVRKQQEISDLKNLSKVTLYHVPGSRSTRVEWLLGELEVEHDVFDVAKQKGLLWIKSEEYTQINPNATLPAMVDGNLKYFEAGAMIKYILNKYPKAVQEKGLVPKSWKEENWTRNDQYAYWCIQTLDGRLLVFTQVISALVGSTITKSLLVSNATKEWFITCMKVISKDLGDKKYTQGDTFTLTDIYLGFTLGHAFHGGLLPEAPKNVQDYYLRIRDRPTFKKAVEGSLFSFYPKK
jgi:glutathione S-transferase